jgi:ketosteroid isomerase-like protein
MHRTLLAPLLFAAIGTVSAQTDDKEFRAFLNDFEAALTGFVNGDASLWKKLASKSDDGTIMGGWGAYEKGWSQVGPRYDWAASQFSPSGAKVRVEYLTVGVSGPVAYTVSLERSDVKLKGMEKPAPMVLRVTHIFRKESEGWKLIHRHADAMPERVAPGTVLKK